MSRERAVCASYRSRASASRVSICLSQFGRGPPIFLVRSPFAQHWHTTWEAGGLPYLQRLLLGTSSFNHDLFKTAGYTKFS